jgi:hypothetical protein
MNLPSLHGFVKFPDGFPAARIRLEWEHYPTVAEGFIERKPAKPDEPGRVVRGGGSKPQGGDDDVGRGDVPGLTEEEVEPANVANTFATNILSQPTENEVDNSRDAITVEATARTEPQVPLQDLRELSRDDDRKDRERSLEGKSVQATSSGRKTILRRPESGRRTCRSARRAMPSLMTDTGCNDALDRIRQIGIRRRKIFHQGRLRQRRILH